MITLLRSRLLSLVMLAGIVGVSLAVVPADLLVVDVILVAVGARVVAMFRVPEAPGAEPPLDAMDRSPLGPGPEPLVATAARELPRDDAGV